MPTVAENRDEWGQRYHWSGSGDEWSAAWGGTEELWEGTLHPRLGAFLPADHILEIAPGFGRVTQFLHPRCRALTVVDLNQRCIDACRDRFAGVPHIRFHVNDGRSLAMVADESVDFAVSFDSLVHADADVVEDYVRQLAAKLTPQGVAFLHHSNAGSYLGPLQRVAGALKAGPLGAAAGRRVNRTWRAADMSSDRFARLCAAAGLRCVGQEVVNWHSKLPNDCFSTVTRPGSRWDREPRTWRNLGFMAEVRTVRARAELYGSGSFGPGERSASPGEDG